MKTRSNVNYIALAISFALMVIGYLDGGDVFIFVLLAAAVTGFIQIFIALTMLQKNNSRLLDIYFIIAFLFPILFFLFGKQFYILSIPPCLAIFLTYIVYIERKKELEN